VKWKSLLSRVKVKHIKAAIDEIRDGARMIPRRRRAKKWFIATAGSVYPTKYILARAVAIATGIHFPTNARSGGQQTVDSLKKIIRDDRRFRIIHRRP
jgi:hypothetical protein